MLPMAVVGTLVTKLTLSHAAFARGMNQSSRSVVAFSGVIKGATGTVNLFGAALYRAMGPLLGIYGVFRAFKLAETFQQEMNSSLAIVRNMTPQMRKVLEEQAKAVARDTRYSATEIAKGYYYLFSAGLDANQVLASVGISAKFSQAAMADMATSTDILTDAVTALGMDSKDSATYLQNITRVADVLGTAASNANATIVQFGEALTEKAAARMRILNIPLEEGVAVLQAFASQAKKGAEGGTAFDIVMRDLTKNAIEHAEAWQKAFGRDVIFAATGALRQLPDIIADMEKIMETMTPKARTELLISLGIPAKSAAYTAMLIGLSDQMREWTAQNKAAGGAIEDIASKQLPPFTKALENLRDILVELAVDKLTPVLNGIGRALGRMLDRHAQIRAMEQPFGNVRSEAERIANATKGWEEAMEGVIWLAHRLAIGFVYLKAIIQEGAEQWSNFWAPQKRFGPRPDPLKEAEEFYTRMMMAERLAFPTKTNTVVEGADAVAAAMAETAEAAEAAIFMNNS